MQSLTETAAALKIAKLRQGLRSDGQLVPVTRSIDATGQSFQSLTAKHSAGLLHVTHFGFRTTFDGSIRKRQPGCPPDVAAGQPEALRDLVKLLWIIDVKRLAPVHTASNNIWHVQCQCKSALHRRAADTTSLIQHQSNRPAESVEFRQHDGLARRRLQH